MQKSRKARRDNFYHALTHHKNKVVVEDYGNSRDFHGTIIRLNGKVDTMFPSMICQMITKKCVSKEEIHYWS